MSGKISSLQKALQQGSGRSTSDEDRPGDAAVQAPTPKDAPKRPQSRAGKKNISAWLDPAYARSLLMVRAVTGKNGETLLAEALNDLFAKYDVPQIRED